MSRKKSTALSDKESRALEFITKGIETNGRAPILREISAFMGWNVPSTAHFVVRSLCQKGYLVRDHHRPITLPAKAPEPV